MKSRVGRCPACGAEIVFEVASSRVAICEHCHSAIARGDQRLEDYGKVADLAPSRSPLRVGLQGRYSDKPFELVGRVQYQHPAGGFWNEWYMAFSNGRWGWLAEAQGRLYVTFDRRIKEGATIPEYESLEVGKVYQFGDEEWKVAEKNHAVAASAEGEIPWAFQPGAAVRFADLEGGGGKFATLDFSDAETRVYTGREVELSDLGLRLGSGEELQDPKVEALQLSCPNCGGPLALVAPDQAQRVTCPNCNGLLDADKGALSYLMTLKPPKIPPVIPLGRSGRVGGVEYTVIGYLIRTVTFDGVIYPWQEYLLYSQEKGFRWLVHSDEHWSFVQPVAVGDVRDGVATVTYKGEEFRIFQRAPATVRSVLGEFYWKVQAGEVVECRDYIAPPFGLTIEESNNEQNISVGRYMPHAEVEEAFGLSNLARGWGVAPNQPAPRLAPTFGIFAAFVAVLLVIDGLLSMRKSPTIDQSYLGVAMLLIATGPVVALLYRWNFEVRRWKDSEFNPYASSGDDDDE